MDQAANPEDLSGAGQCSPPGSVFFSRIIWVGEDYVVSHLSISSLLPLLTGAVCLNVYSVYIRVYVATGARTLLDRFRISVVTYIAKGYLCSDNIMIYSETWKNLQKSVS